MTYEVKAEKISDLETETAESYVKKLREFQEDGTYVMLCDGTWQKCSYNLSDLNSQDGNYARTVDGYLRIKRCVTVNHGIGWPSSFYTRYLLADFPPQKPDASVIGCVKSSANAAPVHRAPAAGNTTYYDVEIAFKNIEGCEEIEVEQTDEDYPVPYYYYVDPKAGTFTTTMVKGVKSEFRLSYINKNGTTSGEPFLYKVPEQLPIVDPCFPGIIVDTDKIKYDFKEIDNVCPGAYHIVSLKSGNVVDTGAIVEPKGEISTASLPKGNYSIVISDADGNSQSLKWSK